VKLLCKACGAEVVHPQARACGHNAAPVLADLRATCYGEGGAIDTKQNALEKLIRAVLAVIRKAKT
jgi:hypothetical protein